MLWESPAQNGRQGEGSEAVEEDPSVADHVSQTAVKEDETTDGEQVDGGHPLRDGYVRAEVLRY